MSHIKNIGKNIGQAVADGGKLALADQFNEVTVDLVKTALIKGGVAAEILELEAMHSALKVLSPVIIMTASEYMPDAIPGAQFVSAASKKALEMATVQVLLPIMNDLRPKFSKLGQLAEKLEGSYDGADPAPEGTPSVAPRQRDDVFDRMVDVQEAEKVTA